MPVPILVNFIPQVWSGRYFLQIGAAILALVIIRAYAQGRKTNRERDLHARTILLTVSVVSSEERSDFDI